MKKRISIVLIIILILGVSTYSSVRADNKTNWGLLYKVLDIVKNQFVKKDVDEKSLIYGAIKGVLKSINDPYSRFLKPKSFKEMKIRMDGTLNGIGIEIGIRRDNLTVISPIPDTPAAKAGLKAMDKIVKIDGVITEEMSLIEAVSKIRGPKGSTVVLDILRIGKEKPFKVSIVRDIIKIRSVNKTKLFKGYVGYIKLSTFESRRTTKEVVKAIKDLNKKGMKGLVLDIRYNGGGLLNNAIDIASLFVKKGNVVYTVNREGRKKIFKVNGRPLMPKKPIVVLINESSASASEILAGAIHDNKRGVLVGQHTFGKASVQNIFPLDDGSAVLVTIAKYFTPKGLDISKKGIIPNYVVKIPKAKIEAMNKESYVYKYADDLVLQKGLSIIRKKI